VRGGKNVTSQGQTCEVTAERRWGGQKDSSLNLSAVPLAR